MAEAIRVRHCDLNRISDSPFKSQCPICKNGTLLVRRLRGTYKLSRYDMCIICGQQVIYEDTEIAGEVLYPPSV